MALRDASGLRACAFVCDASLEGLLALFNERGPSTWTLRESSWYGDYLNCRPRPGVRMRIHEPAAFPFAPPGTERPAGGAHGYSALLEIEEGADVGRPAIDDVFAGLLRAARARDVVEIEPYD